MIIETKSVNATSVVVRFFREILTNFFEGITSSTSAMSHRLSSRSVRARRRGLIISIGGLNQEVGELDAASCGPDEEIGGLDEGIFGLDRTIEVLEMAIVGPDGQSSGLKMVLLRSKQLSHGPDASSLGPDRRSQDRMRRPLDRMERLSDPITRPSH